MGKRAMGVRLPEPLAEEIERRAEQHSQSTSDELRDLIRRGLDEDQDAEHLDEIADRLEEIEKRLDQPLWHRLFQTN